MSSSSSSLQRPCALVHFSWSTRGMNDMTRKCDKLIPPTDTRQNQHRPTRKSEPCHVFKLTGQLKAKCVNLEWEEIQN